ncbi:MAG: glycosyltransferase family 4 protein [Anaerolineae bacterium]|nr:glycosyltransferase family 4 protein [Anaerolineae bacterium]
MRILYFSKDYTPHDHRFLSALARTDHQVFYLRLERSARQQEDRALPPEIEMVPWAGGQGPARLQDGPRLLSSLRKVLRKIKPDILHAGPLQTVGLLAALSGFHPLVSMSWGSDLLQDADKNKRYRWATRTVLKRSQILVGDCDAVRHKAVSLGFASERIVTFPWGVDLAHFSPGPESGLRRRAGWEDAFVLLHLRSWEPVYGVDVAARAFVQAAQQRPELRLFLLGGGSLGPQIRRILEQGQVLDRVNFGGQVSQAGLPDYYRAADLYLSASHSDGSSVSLMEALACGLPALVSDIPGNREWVVPQKHGWWFPDNNADALAQAILHAVDERPRLPQMGAQARKLAEQRADWNTNFEQLLRAYDTAVAEMN